MSAEEFAAEAVRRVLGVHAEAWDIPARQGAYDVRITYPDGRVAALEVTSHAAPGRRQLEGVLSRHQFSWPLPGLWWWSIHPSKPSDIQWLREHYVELILLCEKHDVVRPEHLRPAMLPSDVYERACEVDMLGHPAVPAVDGAHVRRASVLPPGDGGAVDTDLVTLRSELAEVLDVPQVARRIRKVIAADADEAHLFLVLDYSALPFPTFYGLAFEQALPPEPPTLPSKLSHLWLVPRFGARLLLWDGTWSEHHPFVEPRR